MNTRHCPLFIFFLLLGMRTTCTTCLSCRHGLEAPSNGVGWLLDTEDGSGVAPLPRSVVGSLPLPSFQHPGHAMLELDGYKQQPYTVFRQRALDERHEQGVL